MMCSLVLTLDLINFIITFKLKTMKRILLALAMIATAGYASSQVICSVEAPASIQGGMDYTYPGTDWAAIPDITDPLNAVQDTVVIVDDASPGDSLGCNVLVNNAAIAGNIAMVYRGDCEFGAKALNAENAGAIAVIIVNNISGPPVGMGAGTDGPNVTIPVVMISDVDGATIRQEMDNGSFVEVFIGNKSGLYAHDLGMLEGQYFKAKSFATPLLTAQNASEFEVEVGAWVFNFGFEDITNVSLNATIDNGSLIYNESSTPQDIPAGDTVFIPLATFSQATYTAGNYNMEYSLTSDSIDDYPADNVMESDFMLTDDLFSFGRLDETTLLPINGEGFRSSTAVSSFATCVAYSDPNGSRVGVQGINFSASTGSASGTSLDGEPILLTVWQWDDVFTDLAGATDGTVYTNDITEVGTGEFYYTGDDQSINVYGELETPIVLADNQRYMFCITTYNEDVFLGHDPGQDFTFNMNNYNQPMWPVESDGSYNVFGFGADVVPAMSIKMFDANELAISETETTELSIFPNPAATAVTVIFGDDKANDVVVYDLTGKVVYTQNISNALGNVSVDVSNIANGNYIFKVNYDNGTTAVSNVVVNH